MTEDKSRKVEEKETGRLESFSDGIFAFAITLLVLGLHDPVQGITGNLLTGLEKEWPDFFAFFTSFVTILIMWINHHNMFNYIRKVDTPFMFLNGFLLLFVTITPFTTSLIADHILDSNASIAAAVYSGEFLLLSVIWNMEWRYASTKHRLLSSAVTVSHVKSVDRNYNFGCLMYVIIFALAFLSGIVSVIGMLLIGAFFAFTASSRRPLGEDSFKEIIS